MSAPAKKRRKQRRGFACMPAVQVAAIAKLGGIAVSRDASHMAAIGALGGSRRKHWRKGTRRSKPPAAL